MEETGNSTSSATYIGVRKRKWGKWVSEIREPGKKTRIWLGSFETPEMAAVAHDVAAFWLKGQNARLNFPDSVGQYRKPLSSDPNDVRSAALEAALEVKLRQSDDDDLEKMQPASKPAGGLERSGSGPGFGYGGNDWGPDSPMMWRELAEAMLVSPPQLSWPEVNHEVEVLEHGSNLWGLF